MKRWKEGRGEEGKEGRGEDWEGGGQGYSVLHIYFIWNYLFFCRSELRSRSSIRKRQLM